MTPGDARHGTYAGAVTHWLDKETVCEPCRVASNRYRKRLRWAAFKGQSATVSSLGTTRRLNALQALGYSIPTIAREAGMPVTTIRNPNYRGDRVWRATAEQVAEVYERLCMTRPEGRYPHRSRLAAARKGWPPPLAWDDIDDPTDHPRDWHYTAASRAEQFAELYDRGDGLADMCRSLHLSEKSLEKWCQRNDRAGDFTTLRDRDRGYVGQRNQYSEEAS